MLGLLQYCGGLPLSLAIAASSVRSSFYHWGLVLEDFSNGALIEEEKPITSSHFSPEDRYLHSSIAVSLKVLGRSDPKQVSRFKALAVFRRRSRIPVQILAILWSCDSSQGMLSLISLALVLQ